MDHHWRDPTLGRPDSVALPAGTIEYHDAGSGPVLVFVHGYLVNANIWRKLVPLLTDRFRCITPDWPLGSHRIPMDRDADLSPPGIAALIADFAEALELDDITLVGNDSGGAYSQITTARHPGRIGKLVLNTCETPDCTWPPRGFGILKAAARNPLSHLATYQALRIRRTWRWRNTYGLLTRYPIDAHVMETYIRPVLADRAIRRDGRKVVRSVSARYSREAVETLSTRTDLPILLSWAAEDRIFPLTSAEPFAARLGATLRTIDDSLTYTAEDQPAATAAVLQDWRGSENMGAPGEDTRAIGEDTR